MLVSMPLAPAGTFINTDYTYIVAVFPQNYLTNVEASPIGSEGLFAVKITLSGEPANIRAQLGQLVAN